MTLRMADSIVAANLPPGMDAYAGYVDGSWPDYPDIVGIEAKHYLSITVYLANEAMCLDVENGDATADQAGTFVDERRALGIPYPVLYTSISNMGAVVAALGTRPRNTYKLWSAHYDASIGAHICGPGTCAYFERLGQGTTPQCDGTQWVDHGGWDESLLADDFFGPAVPPAPPAPPPGPQILATTPDPEVDNMQQVLVNIPLGADGTGYLPGPLKLPDGTTPPWSRFIAATINSANMGLGQPATPGTVKAQNDGGIYLEVEGGTPGATYGVYVALTGGAA